MHFVTRPVSSSALQNLQKAGIHPLLAQLFAARGVTSETELNISLPNLLPPHSLKGAPEAALLLADAIANHQHICIVADYDCDGASACAVAIRGLRLLGANSVSYIVPNRVHDGYGLTAALAQRVADLGAQVLVTVDNGIASIDGVAHAKALGLQVLVTDHHLPANILPSADVIVNPNQPDCRFASKNLAGVGVMFYVLLALRTLMREHGIFNTSAQPNLASLLPLVALGTIADLVPLDTNNRLLATQGLARIRAGKSLAGIEALFTIANRSVAHAQANDVAFAIAPRLNSAGRLTDMSIGIECLLTDDVEHAHKLALLMEDINQKRRDMEADMKQIALGSLLQKLARDQNTPAAIVVRDDSFHEGIIGIVAARIKEQYHRPTFVFAPSGAHKSTTLLKGSGRSITGFHIRDALDFMAKQHPDILDHFGGHAMAAGCTIQAKNFAQFQQVFESIADTWLDSAALRGTTLTDGPLAPQFCNTETAAHLQMQVWGQGFAAPVFMDTMHVLEQRVINQRHLSLRLLHHDKVIEAMWFGRSEHVPAQANFIYRLELNHWRGKKQLRIMVEAATKINALKA